MRKYRRKNNKIILVLIIAFTLFIGYAVLSKTIDIKGFAGFKKNTWKIVWDADSVEVTSGSTVDVTPIVNEEKNTVTYTAELALPGDFYEFTVDAVNEGSIDGVLSVNSLIPIVTDENGEIINLPEGLIYTIKYADGGELKKNHLLKTGERQKYRIRIEYDKDAENALDEQQISIETKVPYEQTNKDAIDRDTEKYTITFNPNGGDVDEATKKVVMELPIGELPTPTRMEYLFDGWYTELEEGTKIDENTIPDGNLTYYAHWTERVSTFDTGQNVNAKIKKLAGDTLPETRPYSVNDTSITSFERSNTAPDISQMTEDNIISSDDSENPIYAWFDNGTIYWWSEANSADLNADSSYLFNGMKSLANLSLDNLYSSSVTTLQGAFGGVGLTSLDLTKLDTSNVTNMGSMFSGTSFETLDLSKLDTSRVTNMSGMFSNADLNNIDLTKLDISNVTNMTAMFNWSKKTSFDLRSWDTSNVTDMTAMFASTTTTSINISGWNASKVTDMTTMFSSTTATSIDLSGMDVSKVTTFSGIFGGASKLKTVNISGLSFDSLTSLSGLFNTGCTELETINMSNVNTGSVTSMNNMFSNCPNLVSVDFDNINTSSIIDMSYMFLNCPSLEYLDLSDLDTLNVTNFSSMFLNCTGLKNINFAGFNTSKVTSMSAMFVNCSSLPSLDLSEFDIENVTDMSSLLVGCTSLTELNISNWDFYHCPYFNTYPSIGVYIFNSNDTCIKKIIVENATFAQSMYFAFGGLHTLEEISFKNSDASKVTNMSSLFLEDFALKNIDFTGIDTSNVTNMANMFYGCRSLTELDLSVLDTRSVTNMGTMFANCTGLTELDLSTFNTSSLTSVGGMFTGSNNLVKLNISNWDFRTLGSSSFLFSASMTKNIKEIVADNIILSTNNNMVFGGYDDSLEKISLKNINVSAASNLYQMLAYHPNLTDVDISFAGTTNNITNISRMFASDSSLVTVDLSGLKTPNVTDMSLIFDGCTSLESIDFSVLDTRNVTSLSCLFYGCSNLLLVNLNINTGNVTTTTGMFRGCEHLLSVNLSSFDTRNITTMDSMFYGCSSLTSIDMSTFNTQSLTDMGELFSGCTSLQSIVFGNNFDTSNVVRMFGLFSNCSSLTSLDLTSFDTSSLTSVGSSAVNSGMFEGCTNLSTVYVSSLFTVANVTGSGRMFYDCVSLVGGAGTVYDANHIDKAYAHYDGGSSDPGYFTEKGKVSIIYNANGGTGSMSTQRVNSAVSNTLSSNTFTREHYVFTGWNTSSNGSGTPYGNGATIPANTINKYLNLYAQWALHGWIFVNESTSTSLEDQQWSYYNTGIRIENGFHVLPDTYGDSRLYYIVDGIAQLGWVKDSSDNWFYFSKSDADGNGYVDCGAYANGTYEIDGVNYTFDENGICINPFNNTGHYINSNQSAMRQKDIDLIKKYFSGYIY